MEIVKNGLTEKVKSSGEKIKTIEVSFTTLRAFHISIDVVLQHSKKFNLLS